MTLSVKTVLAALVAVAILAQATPLGGAASASRTWTQTAQTDFLQGSGLADLYSFPGSVAAGLDLSTDKARWRLDQGADVWSRQSSPYVFQAEGSLYGGRDNGGSWESTWMDVISTPIPGRNQVTLYLYPQSSYSQYGCNAYADLYFRFTDGARTTDNLLWGVRASSWSGYFNVFGSYAETTNLNGWTWYKFVLSVPGDYDLSQLRGALYQRTYSGTNCGWGTPRIYMYQNVAFAPPRQSEFVSNVHDAGALADFGHVTYSGSVPLGGSLVVETRTSGDGLVFSPWARAYSGEPLASPAGRFVQYRASFTLSPSGVSPRLDEVSIAYSITTDSTAPRTAASVSGRQGCAGWIVDSPLVTLTGQDDLSGVQSTFVSVDQGLFAAYAGPFGVADGAHTIDFYSVDAAGNVESPRSFAFKADTAAPETTLRLSGPHVAGARTFVGPATTIALEAVDATSGVKSTHVDTGAGAAVYAGAFALAGDGPRTLAYASEDAACNAEALRSVGLFVDATPPTLEVTSPAPTSASAAGRSTGDVEPADETMGRLASLGIYGSDADTLASILAAGAAEVCGPLAAERCEALALATLAPSLGGAVVVGELTVAAEAADVIAGGDASGLAYVAFYVDGALRHVDAEAPFAWTWDASSEAMGRRDVTVLAMDNVGNSAQSTIGVSVVPTTKAGLLATGADVLAKGDAPAFTQALYAFVAGKATAIEPPAPPTPPPPPVPVPPVEVPPGVPTPPTELPPLPVEPPAEVPPVEPPGELPGAPTVPPVDPPAPPGLPEIPGVCLDDTCVLG